MKTLLALILCLTSIPNAKAECYYSTIHLKFQIETKSEKIIGFRAFSSCDFNADSINNQHYLANLFRSNDSTNNIHIYKNRTAYTYCIEDVFECLNTEKDSIFYLFDNITLNIKDIISIKVIEQVQQSAFDGLSTNFDLTDTNWLNTKPLEVFHFGAYLCSNKILIYETDQPTKSVLYSLKKLQLEVDELDKKNEITPENGDYYDTKFSNLIDQLNLKNMVIITSCTD